MTYTTRNDNFIIEAFINLDSGETIDISENLRQVAIKMNYIEESFPLYALMFTITPTLNNKLTENNFNVSLKVGRFEVNEDNLLDKANIFVEENIENVILRVFDKKYSYQDYGTDSENSEEEVDNVIYTVAGIPENLIKNNSQIINNIYRAARIEDVIVHMASSLDIDEIFLDKPDNREIINTVLLPPTNFISAIKHLEEKYGVYNNYSGIFFEGRKLFIYKLENSKRDFRNTINIYTKKLDDTNVSSLTLGVTQYSDKGDNLLIERQLDPVFVNIRHELEDVVGDRSVMTSYDSSFNVVKREYENEVNYSKTRFFWNPKRRPVFEESIVKKFSGDTITSSLTLVNANPNLIGIDTLVQINALNKKMSGSYGITGKFTLYSRTDNRKFTNSIDLALLRI